MLAVVTNLPRPTPGHFYFGNHLNCRCPLVERYDHPHDDDRRGKEQKRHKRVFAYADQPKKAPQVTAAGQVWELVRGGFPPPDVKLMLQNCGEYKLTNHNQTM